MEAKKEEDRDEDELIKQVKPLLEQADKTLNETKGAVNGADPEKRLTNRAKRNMQDHVATPSEQRLAEALKVASSIAFSPVQALFEHAHICFQLVETVEGTVKWAKDKLDNYPKAKRDLGPLLDALSRTSMLIWNLVSFTDRGLEPITQIVGGVALLVAGVLNLLGNLVSLEDVTEANVDSPISS